jgi:predicted dehydrogenase
VTLGAIALQGVRIANVQLGETVAVLGLGLLGQLTVQILKASGCKVLGIDLDPSKVALATELGADAAISRADDVAAAVANFTDGVGMDAVIVAAATDSNDPIELAGEICRDRGVVSMVGAVKMDIPRKVYYEKELQLRLSRSYGPGRYDPEYEEGGRDYPIGYVRWTERRNMQEFLRLVSTGQVTPSRLTTHEFPIDQAERAYAIVTGEDRQPFLGVILTYPETGGVRPQQTLRGPRARSRLSGKVGIGFIGAGNFAQSVLLPRFSKSKSVALVGVSTATGMNARTAADRFGFGYCSTDTAALLRDDAVHAVVVATRHGSHAKFAADALRAGKAVFVEKPLAITEDGLARVLEAQAESGQLLTVGFNRRFSSLASELKKSLPTTPLAITYRVNAGPIPRDSWIHDPEEGGGRIIGEVCHFVDLIQFLTGSDLVEVFAHSLGGTTAELHDTVTISLRYRNGSVASINYFSTGDRSFPKERIEVFGGGTIGILDDFRHLTVSHNGKRRTEKRMSQDKGFDQEIGAFLAAVGQAGEPPIPLPSLVSTTRATFAIEASLRSGEPVQVPAE